MVMKKIQMLFVFILFSVLSFSQNYDLKLVDGRMNFFWYDDYHDWFSHDWFHSTSHYGLLPQNEFNNEDLISRFNVIVENAGSAVVNPIVTVEIFDPEMSLIFSYSTTSETVEMSALLIDTVDITDTGFYPGVDPELGRYTILYTVNIDGQIDENPDDNSFTAYFEVTDNVISRYLDNTSGSTSMREYDGGGMDGERMAVPMVFNYNDIIYSMDVYIADNTSAGTGVVGLIMRFDYNLGEWVDISSSAYISLDEGNIGGWINLEFVDPVEINELNNGNSTQLLFALEFYYEAEETNEVFIGYDPNVPSSFWGVWYYFLDGIEPENWFSMVDWNGRGLCLKVNVGGDTEYCPDDMNVCINEDPIALSELISTAGTFTGDGIEDGMFYPAIAGQGDHIVINNFEDSQCTFIISVKGIIEQLSFVTEPNDGILMLESMGTVTINSSDENLLYWTTINGEAFGDTISGNGGVLILETECSTGTYTLWSMNEFGCSSAGGIVSFVENDGIAKIVATATKESGNVSFNAGDVNLILYRQYLNESEELITEMFDEQILNNQNIALFSNLLSGNYFLQSTIISPNYSELVENVFWDNSLLFDDASIITIDEYETFFANINHNVLNNTQGTNTGNGTVGDQPEGKSLNPLEGKVVVLRNAVTDEILDIAITDENGHYSLPAIPDNTNINIFVTMPESPIWTAYSALTETGETISVDFIVSGNSVYPVVSSVDNELNVLESIVVSPNPCFDKINLNSDLSWNQVKIFDYAGKLVINIKGSGINSIDVSALSPGQYIIVGVNENSVIGVNKFVKY